MNKFLSIALLFSSISYADVDIGEDFTAGDLVAADEFNAKFNALNGVVGEILDTTLIGDWQCTSYKDYQDPSHLVENGGNGQLGAGYFSSNTGTLNLTESQTPDEKTVSSPGFWTIDRDDIIFDNEYFNEDLALTYTGTGQYSLLGNTLFFFDAVNTLGEFNIKQLSETKMYLTPTARSIGRGYVNPFVICEKAQN